MHQQDIVVNQGLAAIKMRGFNKNFKVLPKQNGADICQRRFTGEGGGGNY
jgi:hypothetical protein